MKFFILMSILLALIVQLCSAQWGGGFGGMTGGGMNRGWGGMQGNGGYGGYMQGGRGRGQNGMGRQMERDMGSYGMGW